MSWLRRRCCSLARRRRRGRGRLADDGDRLARGQLHLRRGRALARQRLGTVRDQVRDRSRRLRLRRLGCEYDPARVYGDSRGERLPPLRRGADPQRPGGGRGAGQPRLLGGEGRERLAGVAGAARGTSASRRRRISWPRSPGATTCGWSCSRSAPTTSASASWWPDARSTGRAAPRTNRRSAATTRRPSSKRRCRGASAGLPTALRGVRATMAAAGYRRSDYRLLTMGYASPFPAGRWIRYPEDGWSRLTEGGCPVWNADADWAAGDRHGRDRRRDATRRRGGRGRVPRPPPRPRRPPALRSPLAPGRPGGPVAGERRVGPPPRLRPGLEPRIAPPQRLRPARDRRLHRPPLREPARATTPAGDARPRLRRRRCSIDACAG